jgi:hypothetical protein
MALPSTILQRGTRAAQPAAATANTGIFYIVTDEDYTLEQSDGTAWVQVTPRAAGIANTLLNGGFTFANRQNAGVAATYSNTAARVYGPDRWAITNENASVEFIRVATDTPETGITNRFYGTFTKITNAGKMCISQVIEGSDGHKHRGRTVRVQLKMKASTATTMRVALLQLAAAGTQDTVPGYAAGAPSGTFIYAFGADCTDPTFGTDLAKITPIAADNATIASTGLSCSVTTAWQQFGGTFTLPSDYKNLVLVIFTNADIAATTAISVTEAGLYGSARMVTWDDLPFGTLQLLLQRYYYKSFPVSTIPAQSAGLTGAIRGHVSVAGASANQPIGVQYAVGKRLAAPTITFFNPSNADAFVRNTTAGTNASATAAANNSRESMDIMFTGLAAWTVAQAVAVHYTLDAEL